MKELTIIFKQSWFYKNSHSTGNQVVLKCFFINMLALFCRCELYITFTVKFVEDQLSHAVAESEDF